jgi:carbamoyltransferase
MYILGISGGVRQGNQDGAACLLKDNRIIAAGEEERFNRIKHAAGCLPRRAVAYCLRQAGISLEDVDVIAFPGETYKNFNEVLRRFYTAQFGCCPAVELVNHHVAHAASAYRLSGCAEASVVTFDLSGDSISTLLAHGRGQDLELLDRYDKPNSLGIYYSLLTQYLGFRRDNDEYKVMGLAAYGTPEHDLSWLLTAEDGRYRFNDDAITPVPPGGSNPSKQEPFYSEAFLEHYPRPRRPDDPIEDYHKNFACSGQKLLEDTVIQLVRGLVEKTGSADVCLAGGVALNCAMIGILARQDFVRSVFVPPVASDAGLAIGSALEVAVKHGFGGFGRLRSSALGPQYSNEEVREALDLLQISYEQVDNPEELVARDIADGKIAGWFSGRMEYGPRALGNRSILADPRRAEMKDILNARVKYREEFRPFAPAVLEEKAGDYFHGAFESPFMTAALEVREDKRSVIPAVTHVNGTARIQTVGRDANPRFHGVIAAFERITGVPIIINTSFNLAGQPIVENPKQAVSTFFGCGMDVLYIENFKVCKPA